ncbi:hypothetical protein TNCV_1925921 [Trichonephila clavipes]|nr:hypothetical protein TNCV_1925921 [Trichonephila clavipes]
MSGFRPKLLQAREDSTRQKDDPTRNDLEQLHLRPDAEVPGFEETCSSHCGHCSATRQHAAQFSRRAWCGSLERGCLLRCHHSHLFVVRVYRSVTSSPMLPYNAMLINTLTHSHARFWACMPFPTRSFSYLR